MHRVVRAYLGTENGNYKWKMERLPVTRLLDLNFAKLDDGLNVGVIRNVSENF